MRGSAAFLAGLVLVLSGRADSPPLLEGPAHPGSARADDAVKPAAATLAVPEEGVRIVPDHVAEAVPQSAVIAPTWTTHPVDDFLNHSRLTVQPEPPQSKYASQKFGDGFKDLLDPDKPKEWLFSDHGFDSFISPISNPFLAEDPRALTEIRPIFIYQSVPGSQPNFQGGNIWFLGARASVALTDRFSITLNKLGGIDVAPSNPTLPKDFSFSELWLGAKYTFWRDTQTGTIAAGGLIFQIPTGDNAALQNTGNLSLTPYVTVGQTLQEFKNFGTLNGMAIMGYTFATNAERSNYFYASAHLDFDVGDFHRFYPTLELNWFQYGHGGERYFSGQGQDLINTGSEDAANATLFTIAFGSRFKITEASQIGAAFELPLMGNKDLFQYRFTIDFIFRY